MSILVIGVGNPLRGDDAVGPAVLEALSQESLPQGVVLHNIGGDAADLIDLLEDGRAAVIVDAVAADEEVGKVLTIDCVQPLPQQQFLSSSHAFGVAEGVELARTLGQLPSPCFIVGITANKWAMGGGLSQPMKEAVPRAVAVVKEKLNEMIGVPNA